jgi:hypothetical protein
MPVLTIKKPLREKLGDEAVDSLIDIFNQFQSEQKKDIIEIVEEKFERRLSEEISTLKVTILEKIAEVDNRLSEKIGEVDKRLFQEISKTREDLIIQNSKTRADLIKWMFIFWAGQIAVIFGILYAFLKT